VQPTAAAPITDLHAAALHEWLVVLPLLLLLLLLHLLLTCILPLHRNG
jgi:hypothetical protein